MPMLNRENDYFIYQSGKDICTNILVEEIYSYCIS